MSPAAMKLDAAVVAQRFDERLRGDGAARRWINGRARVS